MQIGLELAAARDRARLSTEQIAERTKIQLYRIEALEAGKLEQLPQGIYLDGIVRAYAHEVGIDPEPLLSELHLHKEQHPTQRVLVAGDLADFHSERPSRDEAPSVLPPPTRFRFTQLALPLLMLIAAAGWGAYVYERGRPSQRGRVADTISTASPALKELAAEQPPSPNAAAIKPQAPQPTVSAPSLSGSWVLATHVESSSYSRFAGLDLGYQIQLEQSGDRVIGNGRKVRENASEISSRGQTPISIDGTIEGERVMLNFTERGTRRSTRGKIVLLVEDGATMRGRFSSTAARSAGTVEARRASNSEMRRE